MSVRFKNLENDNRVIVSKCGCFEVLEYVKDPSVAPDNAMQHYFMSKMDVRKRQLLCRLNGENSIIMQAGAMHWMAGDVQATTGLKGVGDFLGKVVKSKVTNESAIKPEYVGTGTVALEPTSKYIILQNVEDWGEKGITVEDGMFLACEGSVQQKIAARKSISSAIAGSEGFFNLSLRGTGAVALESTVPYEETIEIILDNDVIKIDGPNAICWSTDLEFTVERSSKTLIGSAINSEGLVNVYRGTGRVLISPLTQNTFTMGSTTHSK